MEYVDGEALTDLLRRRGGKLPAGEVGVIIENVCVALESAHAEGVVHRDLKPGNIMQDQQGRIVVMDFGLAHSAGLGMDRAIVESPGSVPGADSRNLNAGTLIGTLSYMSPGQARRDEVDARSDVYSFGLIHRFHQGMNSTLP